MSAFSDDLLRAAARLHARRKGQKGPLKGAYVRRSISTIYYAVFHFVSHEAAIRLVGTGSHLRRRQNIFTRTISHGGVTTAFQKLKGATIDKSVEEMFRLSNTPAGPIVTPTFVRQIAIAYLDAKAKREDADYNLNEPLSRTDALQLRRRVTRAMQGWEGATTASDRDIKHVVALLVALKGKLRDS